MTIDRDTARIVQSWLRSDAHDSADRVLATALETCAATRQHRSWWPMRRIADMNSIAKFAVAAAAVLVVAVAGYTIVRPPSFGPGTTVASPSPSPSPSPAVTPDQDGNIWRSGTFEVGRQSATMDGVPFSFAIPSDGWRSDRFKGMLETGVFPGADYAWVGFGSGSDRVNDVDPCKGVGRSVAGLTIDDLAQAYTAIPGTDAVGPTDVTVGGRPAKLVVLTIHEDIACPPKEFDIGGQYPNALSSEIKLWLVDLGGPRFEIHADRAAANPGLDQQIEDIVDSVEFE